MGKVKSIVVKNNHSCQNEFLTTTKLLFFKRFPYLLKISYYLAQTSSELLFQSSRGCSYHMYLDPQIRSYARLSKLLNAWDIQENNKSGISPSCCVLNVCFYEDKASNKFAQWRNSLYEFQDFIKNRTKIKVLKSLRMQHSATFNWFQCLQLSSVTVKRKLIKKFVQLYSLITRIINLL